jgi:ubiquinone/menaquinone biosynthesis C-methylase UbiE
MPRQFRRPFAYVHSNILNALLVALFLLASGFPSFAQAPADEKQPEKKADENVPAALAEYKGRRIAPTMGYQHADWLTRDEREKEERSSEMLKQLNVKPGQTVCDFGCGNGFHTLKLAKLVGPTGKVLAVDIQQEMLDMLQARAKRQGIENIESVLAEVHDPKLPEGKVDLILLVDVYHELSHPEPILSSMLRSLSKEGRIALVEFRAEDPDVPIRPLHKMSKDQILKEFPANGFKLVGQYDELPWQHLMFFGRGSTN